MIRFVLMGLTLYGLAAGAREASLEYSGRGAVQVLVTARALSGAQPIEGRWSLDGELLLQKHAGKLGGLATTSYGFTVIAGGRADRIKYAPLELVEAVKQSWPAPAPFASDNLWRIKARFHVEAKVGDEKNSAHLTLTYPATRDLKVTCNTADPHAGPFLFHAALTADEALEHADLGGVRVINWLRTGAHLEDGGRDLFPKGALDEKGGKLRVSFQPERKVMELAAEWESGSRLAITQDVDDKSDVYVGTLSLSAAGPRAFQVQCSLTRNY